MGECHLCENISSIDALILMTRVTFGSRTLEQDKYGAGVCRGEKPTVRLLFHTVISLHLKLRECNEELLNYQLCVIVRCDLDSDVCVR